ncbi:MAG: AmmeMemoRadiSam system radical SAM enzyme, partial [Oligoflexales bacterium]|nr:AmmeMemoRadiSam system radical SAM enzyme [Oligoflexales bacterium]
RLSHLHATPLETMEMAARLARRSGLKFVYIGNAAELNQVNTVCPKCGREVIRRHGLSVLENQLTDTGKCPCGNMIKGVWR